MCCSVSASFLVFSLVALLSIFTTTLLNMIFSIVTPKEYETFILKKTVAYANPISLSLLDDLKKVNSYEKTSEDIRALKEKYEISLIQRYSADEIEELNDRVKRFKNVLMAFGIASFSTIVGFIMFFVPIYATNNCGANCSQECDCNCDCYLCLGVTPIKRIILFYLVCLPTVAFSFVSFFLTLSKKSTYNEISSMKDIKEYMNREKDYYSSDYEYDYFGDSVAYNEAQFILHLITLIILIIYPLVVWLASSREEMNPPIVVYQKKTRNVNTNTNRSTELSVGLNVSSSPRKVVDCSYNSHPQPQYRPPPPQPQYRPPPPPPQFRPSPPPPQPHHIPPGPRIGIGIPVPRLLPPEIVISIH